eukprot:TRINITY_DN19792_c0_g1_i1.p1 TRINITY_DN19792_c0_g1~~TRINITY_DN19792_c0_g1_i1.p1  ORF type:complete len:636 (-),score=113.46 TRINITY_DN19792_c0_g1_i1:231-2069(-)
MVMCVKPSEINAGALPPGKVLRGRVLEVIKKPIGSKVMTEVHVASDLDLSEVYLLEGWAAQAVRLHDTCEVMGCYEFSNFVAAVMKDKAPYTPSLANTFGKVGAKTSWKKISDDDGYPRHYPTLSLSSLSQLKSTQQVCLEGLVKSLTSKTVTVPATKDVPKHEQDLTTVLLQQGAFSVSMELWGSDAALREANIATSQAVRVQRALWSQPRNGDGFVLTWKKHSTVTVLTDAAAKAVQEEAVDTPTALTTSGGSRSAASRGEGEAFLASVSVAAELVSSEEASKDLADTLLEIPFVHLHSVRSTVVEGDLVGDLGYMGCKVCSGKNCVKHSDGKDTCYSLSLSLADSTGQADVKCFTHTARKFLQELASEGPVPSTVAEVMEKSASSFNARLRVVFEAARDNQPQGRNALELVDVERKPITWAHDFKHLFVVQSSSPGFPEVLPPAVSENALGQLMIADRRHFGARLLVTLKGKAKTDAAPDNSGIRVRYQAEMEKSLSDEMEQGKGAASAEVNLVWICAVDRIQDVLQLKDGNVLYIWAQRQRSNNTWLVSTWQLVDSEVPDAKRAYILRASSMMTLLKDAEPSFGDEAPRKRKELLEAKSRKVAKLGIY